MSKYIKLFSRIVGIEDTLRRHGVLMTESVASSETRERIIEHISFFNDTIEEDMQVNDGLKATDALVALVKAQDQFASFLLTREQITDPKALEEDLDKIAATMVKTIETQLAESEKIADTIIEDKKETLATKFTSLITERFRNVEREAKKKIHGGLNVQTDTFFSAYEEVLASSSKQAKAEKQILEAYEKLREVYQVATPLLDKVCNVALEYQKSVDEIFEEKRQEHEIAQNTRNASIAAGKNLPPAELDRISTIDKDYQEIKALRQEADARTIFITNFVTNFKSGQDNLDAAMMGYHVVMQQKEYSFNAKANEFQQMKVGVAANIVSIMQSTSGLRDERALRKMRETRGKLFELAAKGTKIHFDAMAANPVDHSKQKEMLAKALIDGFAKVKAAHIKGYEIEVQLLEKNKVYTDKIQAGAEDLRNTQKVLAVDLMGQAIGREPQINLEELGATNDSRETVVIVKKEEDTKASAQANIAARMRENRQDEARTMVMEEPDSGRGGGPAGPG